MILRQLQFVTLLCISSLACRETTIHDEFSPPAKVIETKIDEGFDGNRSLEHARYFTNFWRIAGSPAFDSCVNYITTRLSEPLNVSVLESPQKQRTWIPHSARLALKTPEEKTLLDFADTPLMLCPNSFPGHLTAQLAYIKGGSKESDYGPIDVKGRVVLCDDPPAQVIKEALNRGAIGIISGFVPPYNEPDRFVDIIAESDVPYDESVRSFGLKISPRIVQDLRKMTEYTTVTVEIEINTTFIQAPVKTVVAEIPGAVKPAERILLVAHLDHYKPGANDNASGSATLLEIATTTARLLRSGELPNPSRTFTFLWVDEYRGTEVWMKQHEAKLPGIQAVFVLDMVGGDPAMTGGSFRVEKTPDPAVIWFRPPDLHSGWGVGTWNESELVGSYLNDFYLSIVRRRSLTTGWRTTSNVWEGGSDHDPFLRQGIPSVLSWHFPDPFYHSSLDRIENISSVEMKHAGVSIAAAALELAYGSVTTAEHALDLVTAAAKKRIDQAQANAVIGLSEAQNEGPEALGQARKQERQIIEAWTRWYVQCFESVLGIPVRGASERLTDRVRKESRALQEETEQIMIALDLR